MLVISTEFILILIYLLTVIGLTPGGGSTVHIYTQTIHRTTQLTYIYIYIYIYKNTINNFGWKAFWDSKPEWSDQD